MRRSNTGKYISRQRKISREKIILLILDFLTIHEADMAADYRPEDEMWRQLLAQALGEYLYERIQ